MICFEVRDFEVDEEDEIHFEVPREHSDFEDLKTYFLSLDEEEDVLKM